MSKHFLPKRYDLHRGLNPRKSDLTRPMEFASGMRNAQYTLNGSPEKRSGFQAHAISAGGYGTFLYDRTDPVTELETPQTVSVDKNLWLLSETDLTVSYSGSSSTAQLTFFYDIVSSQYRFQLNEGGVTVLDYPCGLGFEEASTVSISTLSTAINGTSNFSATVTGSTATPAAFIKIVRAWDVGPASGTPWTGIAKYWIQVNCPISNPFSSYVANRNQSNFENVSSVVVNNVLYISNGYNGLFKYDGQTFYLAGLPTPASITSSLAAGAVTGSNYFHQAQYHQEDAAGQIIEGNLQIVSTGLSPAAQGMSVVVANVLAGSGFNTDCAIVNGNQATVNTITVWNGTTNTHMMKINDTAYFFDSVSAAYITRLVTAITATTITVAGAAVTVSTGAVISNNLRINIWRNWTSGTTPQIFFLVVELPNNSFAATQTYLDNHIDTALGAELTPPALDRSIAPQGKYIAGFQNHIVISGDPSHPSRVSWNSYEGPEYFPNDTNTIEAETAAGDAVNGIGPNGTVFGVLTRKCTFVMSGVLDDPSSIRIDQKATDIGCESHASIVQIKGIMCWWSSRGPYGMAGGQIPQPVGTTQDTSGAMVGRLEPVMQQQGVTSSQLWQTKRITSFNWPDQKKAVWFLPAENRPIGSDAYPNSNSALFVYDYDQDAWLQWDTINLAGGAVVLGPEVYFQERRYSNYTSSVQFVFYRMHNLYDAWDYEDNNKPINWEYDMGWEANDEPSVLNRFLQVKVFALEEVPNNSFTIQVDQEINYQHDASVATFFLDFSGSGYGVSEYGVNPYGDSAEGSLRHDLNRERCKSMRLRFSDSTDQSNCLFTGVEYEVAFPYRKVFKV
jgi:hypothetical protein